MDTWSLKLNDGRTIQARHLSRKEQERLESMTPSEYDFIRETFPSRVAFREDGGVVRYNQLTKEEKDIFVTRAFTPDEKSIIAARVFNFTTSQETRLRTRPTREERLLPAVRRAREERPLPAARRARPLPAAQRVHRAPDSEGDYSPQLHDLYDPYYGHFNPPPLEFPTVHTEDDDVGELQPHYDVGELQQPLPPVEQPLSSLPSLFSELPTDGFPPLLEGELESNNFPELNDDVRPLPSGTRRFTIGDRFSSPVPSHEGANLSAPRRKVELSQLARGGAPLSRGTTLVPFKSLANLFT